MVDSMLEIAERMTSRPRTSTICKLENHPSSTARSSFPANIPCNHPRRTDPIGLECSRPTALTISEKAIPVVAGTSWFASEPKCLPHRNHELRGGVRVFGPKDGLIDDGICRNCDNGNRQRRQDGSHPRASGLRKQDANCEQRESYDNKIGRSYQQTSQDRGCSEQQVGPGGSTLKVVRQSQYCADKSKKCRIFQYQARNRYPRNEEQAV